MTDSTIAIEIVLDGPIIGKVNVDSNADSEDLLEHDTRFYWMTFVSVNGEEFSVAPCYINGEGVSVAICDEVTLTSPSTETVTLTLPCPLESDKSLVTKRIYRTNPTRDCNFCLVKEVAIGVTSTIDDVLSTDLGPLQEGVDYITTPTPPNPHAIVVISLLAFAGILYALFNWTPEPEELVSGPAAIRCVEVGYRPYEEECKNHKVVLSAFVIEQDSRDLTLNIGDPKTDRAFRDDEEFFVRLTTARGVSISSGDKVEITGVFNRVPFLRIAARIGDASIALTELTDYEQERRDNYMTPRERREAENSFRMRALIEQAEVDAELGRIAREQRAELMEEAIAHSTLNVGGLLIDSYELPGNRFIACRMTFPGPIYSCDR